MTRCMAVMATISRLAATTTIGSYGTLGDGSDTADGGTGNDLLEVSGGGGDDALFVIANGSGVFVTRDGQPGGINVTNVEQITVTGGAGNDTIGVTGNVAALTHLTWMAGPVTITSPAATATIC